MTGSSATLMLALPWPTGSRRRSRLDGMMWWYRRETSEGEEGPSLAKLRCVGLCDVGVHFFCGCRRDFAHPNLSRCCGRGKLWKSCLGKIRELFSKLPCSIDLGSTVLAHQNLLPEPPDQPKRVGGPWFNEGYSIC
uniref:Uncharacterized protein n=1 Tax=Physcomitrium patens TaxID=3218 RepID=A0A7I3YXK2_PHYPA